MAMVALQPQTGLPQLNRAPTNIQILMQIDDNIPKIRVQNAMQIRFFCF
jgi:hypothetical protein